MGPKTGQRRSGSIFMILAPPRMDIEYFLECCRSTESGLRLIGHVMGHVMSHFVHTLQMLPTRSGAEKYPASCLRDDLENRVPDLDQDPVARDLPIHFKCKGELSCNSGRQKIKILRDLFSDDIKMKIIQIGILVSDRERCLYCLVLSSTSADFALCHAEYMSNMPRRNNNHWAWSKAGLYEAALKLGELKSKSAKISLQFHNYDSALNYPSATIASSMFHSSNWL